MKSLTPIFVFIFALILKGSTAVAAKSPEVIDLSGLTPISMEEEAPVNDFLFSHGDKAAIKATAAELNNLDSIEEVEEEPVDDVDFTKEEAQRYRLEHFEVVLAGLLPIKEEAEAAVSDIEFTDAERVTYGN